MKYLLIEDTKEEKIYLEQVAQDSKIDYILVDNLDEAIKHLDEVDVVVTDVFFPIGSKKNASFYRILAGGLKAISVRVYGFEEDLSNHLHGEEIINFLSELATGEGEVPSGAIIAIKAILQGKAVSFCSSFEHHAARIDWVTWFCRAGACLEDRFIEGIDKETGHKKWSSAIKAISFEDNADRINKLRNLPKKCFEEVEELIDLAENY